MDFKKTPGHDTRAGLALAKINRLTLNMTSVSTDAGSHKALNSRKMSMVSCTCFPYVFFLRVTHQFPNFCR
jgi:hypothetical protein